MLAFLGHGRDELLLVGFVSLFLSVFQVRHRAGFKVAARRVPPGGGFLQNRGTAS